MGAIHNDLERRRGRVLESRSRIEKVGIDDLEGAHAQDEQDADESGGADASVGAVSSESVGLRSAVTMRVVCPLSALARYSNELRTLTSGAAAFSLRPAGYSPLPRQLQDTLIADTLGLSALAARH